MNDQQFVNEYIRVLNETLSEAFNKNLVMQAQLAVSKKVGDKTAELEAKLQNLTNLSSDNNALQSQIGALTSQLEQTRSSLEQRTSHTETFKRDLVDARNQLKNALDNLEKERLSHNAKVDSLNVEIESLKKEVEELKSKKKKNGKVLNTLENSIYVSNDTF
jgi:chromosome segregation ATPase